jgi:dipeptidyl-peptidase-4
MVDNGDLHSNLVGVEFPVQRTFNIPSTAANGLPIRARLFLPATFDENKKYPLFIDVYGGPGSQNVRQSFSINWGTSLVSSHDVIYGFIDGRGSARQTGAHLFQMKHKMGTVEIEDQIAAVKYVQFSCTLHQDEESC